jgi:hypothetical protein
MKPGLQDLWVRLRQGLEEGVSVLWKGTSDLTLKTMAEADTLRLKMEARKLRNRLSEAYVRLGEAVFTEYEKLDPAGGNGLENGSFGGLVQDLKAEIHQLELEVRKIEEEISDLKNLHLNS